MSRRDKRGRVLEIPLPLGSSKVNCPEGAREGGLGHLVTFCLHRKSLAPEGEISPISHPQAKHPLTLRSAIQIDGPMGPISPIRGKCPEGIKGVGIIGPYEREWLR